MASAAANAPAAITAPMGFRYRSRNPGRRPAHAASTRSASTAGRRRAISGHRSGVATAASLSRTRSPSAASSASSRRSSGERASRLSKRQRAQVPSSPS